MAYEVTATRKRPQGFETLIGQEFVVSTIKNAIEQNRIAHAYLFSGPRGVGKTSSARLLAKALNCEHGPTSQPCGECANCQEIAKGTCTDVIEIDGASNTSVNDIRLIKEEVMFPPQTCRYKIYIIDEVHMLSTSAFNALLKTIEEPPEYVIFIFATTETHKVPATIKSRCQQFHFQLIDLNLVTDALRRVSDEMGIKADDNALFWIAKESTGSMRDAYTLFDQVVSFSNDHITLDKIKDKLGLVGTDMINSIMHDIMNGDRKSCDEKLEKMFMSGISVEQMVKDFAQYFRTLMLLKDGITDPQILGMTCDEIPSDIISYYTTPQVEAGLNVFLELYRRIKSTLNPRFEIELAISKLHSLKNLVSPQILIEQLENLKKQIFSQEIKVTGESSPAAAPRISQDPIHEPPEYVPPVQHEPEAEPEVMQEAPVIHNQPSPAAVQTMEEGVFTIDDVDKICDLMQARYPLVSSVCRKICSVSMVDGRCIVEFPTSYPCDFFADMDKYKILRAAIRKITGYSGPVDIKEKQHEEEIKKNKPAVHDDFLDEVSSMFRGEIV